MYYDRSVTTGAQVRVIVVSINNYTLSKSLCGPEGHRGILSFMVLTACQDLIGAINLFQQHDPRKVMGKGHG